MSLELEIQVANTDAFIQADPQLLTIYRTTTVSDGAGGLTEATGGPTVVASGTYRLIPQQDKVPITQTFNGTLRRPDFVLVCLPGTSLAEHDYFDWHGDIYEIGSVHEGPPYEVKADVYIKVG